ncbi:MAG: alpha-amylase family glycosyl hydrolase [Spirochaetes bacterium]|nr:alpha-amylase family glycosyl hydrolase [Spirochaetota bacterium]
MNKIFLVILSILLLILPILLLTTNSLAQWYRETTFYQIFPRSFYDTDGDGIGDIRGIIQKLDYIKSLGVGGIWLNPTFPSPSYHGYDVTDYYNVNPQLGTLEDMKELIKQADKRGIKILLDLVINHTSSEIEWFKKSEQKDVFFNDWYIWVDKIPNIEGKIGWSKPWTRGNSPWEVWSYSRVRKEYYYSAFWSGMPDLNFRNPNVVNEIYKIARYWLEIGVAGFRLDAIRYLVETGPGEGQADTDENIIVVKNFNEFCKKVNPNSFNIGEVWTANETVYKYKDAIDGCFDFELRETISSTVGFGPKVGRFSQYIQGMLNLTKSVKNWKFFYPFSSNHDVTRVHNLLIRRPENFERLKMFYTILFTLPSNPFIYYGDEFGMVNSPYLRGDMAYRDPMVWENSEKVGFTTGTPWTYVNPDPIINLQTQKNDKNSVFNHFLKMSSIRNKHKTLIYGDIKVLTNSTFGRVVSFARYSDTNAYIIIVYPYPSETNTTIYIDNEILKIVSNKTGLDLINNTKITITNNEIYLELKQYTNMILQF